MDCTGYVKVVNKVVNMIGLPILTKTVYFNLLLSNTSLFVLPY